MQRIQSTVIYNSLLLESMSQFLESIVCFWRVTKPSRPQSHPPSRVKRQFPPHSKSLGLRKLRREGPWSIFHLSPKHSTPSALPGTFMAIQGHFMLSAAEVRLLYTEINVPRLCTSHAFMCNTTALIGYLCWMHDLPIPLPLPTSECSNNWASQIRSCRHSP